MWLNYVAIVLAFSIKVPTTSYSNTNKINVVMTEKNNKMKNNNIILYSPDITHKQILKWIMVVVLSRAV